ncbi:bifunctional metallophosphatase/5'-nucleotidase, partial [Bacteroidota bacterium]
MRRKFIISLISFVLLDLLVCNAQVDTLTILHINDTHSCLVPLGPRSPDLKGTQGGIARAATVVGKTKMSEPNVLTLHGGDLFIGDLFFNVFYGAAELQILNSLGFDAICVGNHEFDLTPEALVGALQSSFTPDAGIPLLSANLILEDQSLTDLKEYIQPCVIKQLGSIKVGITPETNLFSLPTPAVIDTNFIQCAAAMVDSFQNNNCDVIICLSHLGSSLDELLVTYIPNIDVIVGAHDHSQFQTPKELTDPLGGTTYLVQAGAFYQYIGKIILTSENGEMDLLSYELIPLDENIPEEPETETAVDGLITQIEAVYGPVYSQQIGYVTELFKEVAFLDEIGYKDTPIGNLVTDAFRWKTGTDIAIQVGGSTSQPLYPGPIVSADVFRVFGYGFNEVNGLGYRLVTFDITGQDLYTGLEIALSMTESNDEFLPQVSGMKYSCDLDNDPFSRIVSIQINDQPLDPQAYYSVTTNEFFKYAQDSLFYIHSTNEYLYENVSEFEVLVDYIVSLGEPLVPTVEGRIITSLETFEDNLLPEAYLLYQNYPNPFNP